ncbi:MAG: hypothetical protein Q9157_002169 [Trypethelium eluteriae]
MLSSSLNYHHYSPAFGHYPNPNGISHDLQQHHQHHTSGLDTLAESSEYALHELQQQQQQQQQAQHSHHPYPSPVADSKLMLKHRHHHYRNGGFATLGRHQKDASAPEKSGRTSGGDCRLMQKEFGLTCEYIRERKKRGKASRKDIARQQAAAAAAAASGQDVSQGSPGSNHEQSPDEQTTGGTFEESQHGDGPQEQTSGVTHPQSSIRQSRPSLDDGESIYSHLGSIPSANTLSHGQDTPGQGAMQQQNNETSALNLPTPRGLLDLGDYAALDDYQRSVLHANGQHPAHGGPTSLAQHIAAANGIHHFSDSGYGVMSPSSTNVTNPFRIGATESPLPGSFLGQSPADGSPSWLSIPSPSAALYQQAQHALGSHTLRYPVLRPLLPHLGSIMPVSLACDLLELYFTSPTSAYMRPESPYLLAYVFRKRSFLRQNNPRNSSPALLASMLWVAAQTSESQFLTSPPSMRGKVCQKLLELTVGLLKPLIHNPSGTGTPMHDTSAVINGLALGGYGQVSLGGFGVGVGAPSTARESEGQTPGASAGLDDVATYVHLATVVSASEHKAASLRWWNAAWSLARELKLGRELPPNPPEAPDQNDLDAEGDLDGDVLGSAQSNLGSAQSITKPSPPGFYSEEEREERRRIWWLVYAVDRHLSLCYNKPLFLLDRECDGLFQPIDDSVWQAGDIYSPNAPEFDHVAFNRRRGPQVECSGHSIFGYFLPLMTILGEIVDLNHARNHPRFGVRFRSNNAEWDDPAGEIRLQLDAYARSLRDFEARHITAVNESVAAHAGSSADHAAAAAAAAAEGVGTPSAHSVSTIRPSEALCQSRIVLSYATHLMRTLHILLNGKWDPISLLDDNDLWISSPSFVSATGHAVQAAEALAEILEHDPDLGFMPFFFGIYLLQGSFLLLLIADKLKEEVGEGVVRACETIVRAHEACVVTLNTEYQRNFRKVMRSALAQVKGRLPEDFGEQQLRRRETLALYRWTGDGTGLAL